MLKSLGIGLGVLVGAGIAPSSEATVPYVGSRFADVWAQVKSDPYTQGYPAYAVTKKTSAKRPPTSTSVRTPALQSSQVDVNDF